LLHGHAVSRVIGRPFLALIGRTPQSVGGATNAASASVQHVRVDHRRPNALVAQEFLYGANIIATCQQVRGEGMPKRVARDSFGQSSLSDSLQDRLLDKRLVNVVPSLLAGFRVHPAMFLWEYELPTPFAVGVRGAFICACLGRPRDNLDGGRHG
jgi:hypothetical protein